MDFGVSDVRAAVLGIDLHRGHLVVTSYRDREEIRSNPFWRTRGGDPGDTRSGAERHNLVDSPGCELSPSVPEGSRHRRGPQDAL